MLKSVHADEACAAHKINAHMYAKLRKPPTCSSGSDYIIGACAEINCIRDTQTNVQTYIHTLC